MFIGKSLYVPRPGIPACLKYLLAILFVQDLRTSPFLRRYVGGYTLLLFVDHSPHYLLPRLEEIADYPDSST